MSIITSDFKFSSASTTGRVTHQGAVAISLQLYLASLPMVQATELWPQLQLEKQGAPVVPPSSNRSNLSFQLQLWPQLSRLYHLLKRCWVGLPCKVLAAWTAVTFTS